MQVLNQQFEEEIDWHFHPLLFSNIITILICSPESIALLILI